MLTDQVTDLFGITHVADNAIEGSLERLDGEHPTSFLVYYVSMNFMLDCRAKWTGGVASDTPVLAEPAVADVTSFLDVGIYDAMEHWNFKNYWLEEKEELATSLRIRPFFCFEEKETFAVDAATAPTYNGATADPTARAAFGFPTARARSE